MNKVRLIIFLFYFIVSGWFVVKVINLIELTYTIYEYGKCNFVINMN